MTAAVEVEGAEEVLGVMLFLHGGDLGRGGLRACRHKSVFLAIFSGLASRKLL
jgi:hypothetical protein